jgi:HD-GYP domain-containing protein (c-di-GMP phosphodiesterase class II)
MRRYNKKDQEYQREFFKRLFKNINLKNEKLVFNRIFGKTIWLILPEGELLNISKDCFGLCNSLKDLKGWSLCRSNLIKIVNKARKSLQLEKFVCPWDLRGFCLPIVEGDKLYGFVLLCHIERELPDKLLPIFAAFTKAVVKDVQKELELSKLYSTIRPRAIALSTIHTVHRLIGSTLDLDELLPRIARLSLQVLRARYCSIMLLDPTKKNLVSKATVNLGKKSFPQRKLKLGKGTEGMVAKTASFLLKPSCLAVPLIDESVIGVISVRHKQNSRPFNEFDQEILITLAEQAVIAIKNAQLYEEQEKVMLGSIESLATILDTRAPYAYTHTDAFVKLVLGIAEEIELDDEQLRSLKFASLLHDAGKIGIPEEILSKPSKLTGKEYRIIKRHPIKGVRIVKPLSIGVLKPVIPIILHHHEKYDGTGYPSGLKAGQIPIGARIMAIADTFEAMVSLRPYRIATSIPQAIEEIKHKAGTQFDPKVVRAFLRAIKRKEIKDSINRIAYGSR